MLLLICLLQIWRKIYYWSQGLKVNASLVSLLCWYCKEFCNKLSKILELIYSCKPLKDETILKSLEGVDFKVIYANVIKPGEFSFPISF